MPTKDEIIAALIAECPEATNHAIEALAEAIITRFTDQINRQEDMPVEFAKLINEHFWELMGIDTDETDCPVHGKCGGTGGECPRC